jgi:hypothetical protein
MDTDLARNKIKLAIVGNGAWGSQVAHVSEMFERFDLIGIIDSSTNEELKYSILNNANMVYIATPENAQLEYAKFCIENDKFCICEAPFLSSIEQRKEIYEQIKLFSPRLFFINSAYYMDGDFARIISAAIMSDTKFVQIKCSGPKFQNDLNKAKKFYSNQAIFLILQIAFAKKLQKFDSYSIYDEHCAEFSANDMTFRFEWDYSEFPQNNVKIHTDKNVFDKTLIYDKYDHVFPMLKFASDQYYKILPVSLDHQNSVDMKAVFREVNLQSFLISCTSEYFSDIFSSTSEGMNINDPLKLFFNGGF